MKLNYDIKLFNSLLLLILYSNNTSASSINLYPEATAINKTAYLDKMNGFSVANSGQIFRTTNEAASWDVQSSGTNTNLNSISSLYGNTAFIVGNNGTISKTNNGGSYWQRLFSNTTENLRQLCMPDYNYCYAIGANKEKQLRKFN